MRLHIIEGQLVDVASEEIIPARVIVQGEKIVGIEELSEAPDRYILPGFIDAHIHIESSLLCPSRFSEAAVPHGTTCIITDPHEIANVLGMEGIRYMIDDAKRTPMRIYFTAPSCVPATKIETSGAILTWREIYELLMLNEVVALGEVMDVQSVLEYKDEILKKIEIARILGKPIDGHAPGLTGFDLDQYISVGISTDHECLTLDEATEKYRKGMKIMIREGSTSKNLKQLAPFADKREFFLVSDDLDVIDLEKGHLDRLLKKAVECGIDSISAIQAVTIRPSKHYGLPIGLIEVGKPADIVIVNNLCEFNVLEVYINGILCALGKRRLFDLNPQKLNYKMVEQRIFEKDLELRVDQRSGKAKVRVIKAVPDQAVSFSDTAELKIVDGTVQPSIEDDVLLVAVVCRYRQKKPAIGFIRGFGLKRGAIASTVAHDAHNIIAVGTELKSMAFAIEYVSRVGGFFATDGHESICVELPIAGLMSNERSDSLGRKMIRILEFVRSLGCDFDAPFMTLSFQSLVVLPEIKICDMGLFDSRKFRFVDPIIELEQ
ncbi:MAG: adenine deaminase [Methanomassiliicoccales archaeon]